MRELSEAACRQGELWGPGARDWAAFHEAAAIPLWSAVLDAAAVESAKRVLDAGCGAGGASVLAAERGANVFGIDPTVNLITIARERLPRGDFRVAELENLPFSNGEFDSAVAINSMQYTANPQVGIHELGRVCRPGGHVVIAVPCEPEANGDMGRVFEAVIRLFPKRPSGRGPFALSAPDALTSLIGSVASLHRDSVSEMDCPHDYPDLESALRAQMSAGPTHRAVEIFGEERVRDAIGSVLESLRRPDGRIRMQALFRYVVARRLP